MIELLGVGLRRRGEPVLSGLFFAAESGQVVLVSGAGGSGKTTLLELLCGRVFADEGRTAVFGKELRRLRASSLALLRQRVSYAPSEILLFDERSALANVAVALEVAGVARTERLARAAAALGDVGLADEVDQPVGRLGDGARRAVCLARALVGEPDVLLADEPTAGLDAAAAQSLVDLIDARRERGLLAVVATSDPRVIAASLRPGWRHLELCGGELLPGDYVRGARGGNLVPFPTRRTASGGISS